MFLYDAYGLRIESAIPLPELTIAAKDEAPIDASITFGKLPLSPPNINGRNHYANSEKIDLHYEGVGGFSISKGRDIIIEPLPQTDARLLRLCILGPALAALLHQKGLMVLHASAVMVNGVVVAFLGDKGFGKSTMAAYLQTRKHRLLADDIVALELKSEVKMWPGFPQLKLWPSAVAYCGLDIDRLPRVQPDLEKRAHRLAGDFPLAPVTVEHIYILDVGEDIEIVPIRAQQAFIELTRNLYMYRFLQATGSAALLFRQCSQLVDCLPVSYLRRPDSLLRLPEIADLLERSVGQSI
jgi:hypothetical protein